MSMPNYRYLFGPVPSRRFGRSLGIDLTPLKTCSLDCVFCQLGRTPRKTLCRKEYVPTADVIREIEMGLKSGVKADYLTLSGSGEPTLHTQFGEVLSFLRHQPIPSALLTNGTVFHLPEVREAAGLARVVKISLSAWSQQSFEWVNRPHERLDFSAFYEGLQEFRNGYTGQLWIEVFLLSGINAMARDVRQIARLAADLRPDRIHLNTIARPPAEPFAAAVPTNRLEQLANLFEPKALLATDISPRQTAKGMADEKSILAMLARRPCTMQQIGGAFGMHINEVSKILGHLVRDRKVHATIRNDDVYYVIKPL